MRLLIFHLEGWWSHCSGVGFVSSLLAEDVNQSAAVRYATIDSKAVSVIETSVLLIDS